MIAIAFALPAESSGLMGLVIEKKNLLRNGINIVTGRVSGKAVEIFHTGVGAVISQRRVAQYLEGESPALMISAGFAGGTRDSDKVGDLVLAENFSDGELLENARKSLGDQPAHIARLFTATSMIDTPSGREEVWSRHQAVAIDMETAGLARICAERRLRLLSIRVLSDTPRHPFPIPGNILFDMERQQTPALRLFTYLLVHPAAIPRLLNFSRRIVQARASLTKALSQILQPNLWDEGSR